MMAAMTAMGQQTVSVADARAKATAFLNRNAGAKGGTVTTDVQLAYTAQQGAETYYYVFNNGSDGKGGFVIIGGDETARTILGYSDNGTFDYATAPENMKWWLSQYEQQISAAIKNGGTTAAAKGSMGLTTIAKADIEPLVKTTWDQRAPYNTAIPKISSNDYTSDYSFATGCVATAMAQIMKYHEHPKETGTGSYGYQINYTSAGTITFEANFGATTYDWKNMKPSYDAGTFSGNEQGSGDNYEKAVAKLMYHCGVAADMLYGQIIGKGSSASSFTAAQGMINYFGYDKGMSYEERAYYSDDDWEEMIYAELAAPRPRPVLYSGRTSADAGHAFICDGYQAEGNLFHINWGWSGNYNSYFALRGTIGEVLKPDGTGTGGGAAGDAYDWEQSVVIGIQPDKGGSNECKVTNPDGYNLNGTATIVSGGTLYLRGQFINTSLEQKNLTLGIRFENTSTNKNIYIKGTSRNLVPNSYPEIQTNVPGFTLGTIGLEAGQYRVYPAYYDNTEDFPTWKDIPTTQKSIPTLEITEGNKLYLMDTPSFGNNGEYTIMDGTNEESLNLTLKFKNNSGANINNKHIRVWIYPDASGQVSSVGYWDYNLTIANGETQTVKLNRSNTIGLSISADSRYSIQVKDYSTSTTLYDTWQTYFIPTNKQTISYRMTSAGWGTLCLPFAAEVPAGLTMYEVTGTNGDELTKSEATTIEMNKAYLVSGTAGAYTFSGPTTPTGTYTNGLLTGNTNSATVFVPQDSYVLQNLTSGLAFYHVAADNTQKCSPYRAYLTLPAGQAGLYSAFFFADGGTTGIVNAENADGEGTQTARKVLKNGRLTIETPQGTFSTTGARMK